MEKTSVKGIMRSLKASLSKHSPEILTGIGIAGMITTVILSVKATPKALILIDNKKEELGSDKIKPADAVKSAWKCYVPAVVTGSLSVGCLICATSVNGRHNAALAAAYTLSESTLKEYRQKVIETIGEKKEESVRDAVAKAELEKAPISNQEIFFTKKGDTLCYDVISGRYFKSDIESIKKTINELNKRMMEDTFVSLNDFYYEIGLDNIAIGDDIGWSVEMGFIDVYFSANLANDETPCLVIDHRTPPQYDYKYLNL